jgi:Ca-activated chloride channel family protein
MKSEKEPSKRHLRKLIRFELLFGLVAAGILLILFTFKNEEFRFLKPMSLYLLPSILFFHWWYLKRLKNRNSLFLKNGCVHRTGREDYALVAHFWFTRSILFLILTLADPSFGEEKTGGTVKSLELVVCVDISNSMNVRDMENKSSRIDAAKKALNTLINKLSSEKIGITLFAGSSLVHLPITSDLEAAKLFTEELSSELIRHQGTNISSALLTAKGMFSPLSGSKAIIVLTDGEDHNSEALSTAEMMAAENFQIHYIGIGSDTGGPIPFDPDRPELGYKKDSLNQTILSKMNPGLIQSLAEASNGSYLLSQSGYPSIERILTQINQIKRSELRDLTFSTSKSLYQVTLVAAMLSLLIVFSLNLFNNKRKL